MFITDEDYKVVIGEGALRIVTQVSTENRANAETEAIEEIAGPVIIEIYARSPAAAKELFL